MRNQSIDKVMTVSPVTVTPGDELSKARQLFDSTGVHHMPVVDDGQLVGILSASDFLKLHLLKNLNESLEKITVGQVMQPNPVVLQSGANLRDAAEKFSAGDFHALPVMGDDGTVVGIVTTSDLVQYLLQNVPRGDGSIQEHTDDARDLAAENRILRSVCDAAEHYMRSGHADREHSVLVQKLDTLRKSRAVTF